MARSLRLGGATPYPPAIRIGPPGGYHAEAFPGCSIGLSLHPDPRYQAAMPDWLSHPHALSVLAAYGVAVLVLLGLVALTLRDWRRAKTAATQARREP